MLAGKEQTPHPLRHEELVSSFHDSVRTTRRAETPFSHWLADEVFPGSLFAELAAIPLMAPDLKGVSGTREVHNETRVFAAGAALERYSAFSDVADLFQDSGIVRLIEGWFDADLAGTYVRLEYCMDTNGFWLKPHTDLGVKRFTMLYYIWEELLDQDLGTDLFYPDQTHAGRAPFHPNSALIFVPSDVSFHGFLPRPIFGVRRSLILNYVTEEWRAREQLAFPNEPVHP